MRGHCFIVRFADDFVIGFQHEDDARRVMEVLPKRFAKYGLELHPEKSRLLSFGKPVSSIEVTRGDSTFDFLGFTHYWARARRGNWVIKRKTASKKVSRTIQSLWVWCRSNRHMDLEEAAPYSVFKASGALPVLWRALQYASDGSGTPPCQAWLEILAQSSK